MRVDHDPEQGTVTVSRPFLRGFLALVLVASCVGLPLSAFVAHQPVGDTFTRGDWWVPLLLLATLGCSYLYVSASLIVEPEAVTIKNAFRRIQVPIGHVTAVEPGTNLVVRTAYRKITAWGVEAANIALVTGHLGRQQDLAELIRTRAYDAHERHGSTPPARARWHWPDPLLLCAGCALVTSAALIAAGFHLR